MPLEQITEIKAYITNSDIPSGIVRLMTLPDSCPLCHTSLEPILIRAIVCKEPFSLEVVFQCPKGDCRRLFIGRYQHIQSPTPPHGTPKSSKQYIITQVVPMTPKEKSFDEEIQDISPGFVEIYNQSIAAEAAGLNQITGVGFRKALEFIIKDFLINEHPDKIEEIKKSSLGSCINNYINDANIKECAKRAVWLGNDETHYMRKWADRDIRDLKILIRLTVHWISNNILTKKYMKEMN
jgi:hypothetical protein